MWIFTTDGFYSTVQHKDNPDLVMVRSRSRDDLERLIEALPIVMGRSEPEILEYVGSDYAYRIFIPRDYWIAYVASAAGHLNYTNFKAEVQWRGETRGDERVKLRLRAYHDIWARLVQWQGTIRRRLAVESHGGGGPEPMDQEDWWRPARLFDWSWDDPEEDVWP